MADKTKKAKAKAKRPKRLAVKKKAVKPAEPTRGGRKAKAPGPASVRTRTRVRVRERPWQGETE